MSAGNDFIPLRLCVLTVSDTRGRDNDQSGDYLEAALREAGHHLVEREILPDDFIDRPRLSRIYYGGKFYHYPLRAFEALGNLEYAAWSMRVAGWASEHDALIAHHVAYVLAGGDGPPRDVSEQDVLDLEREAFLTLLGTKATQERVAYMLETGKPLRN